MLIRVNGPQWAHGCPGCAFGVVSAPVLNRLPLYLERAILAQHGRVVFCECRAGYMARQYARKVWRDLETGVEHLHSETIAAVLLEAATTPTVHGPERVSA